jgi:exonuclease SbcC
LAADLEGQIQAITGEREKHGSTMATARQEAATLGATVDGHERNAAAAATEAAEMATSLRTMASGQDWPQVVAALDKGSNVAPMLKANLDEARREESRVNQAIGSGRARLEQIEANIALAERLREEVGSHRQHASLARDLASMLRTDAFPAFIRDTIMTTLAANGSAWLLKVSGGRYELRVDGQDFDVADLWNAGEERGVRTLSGGETFLASLALALALAELLPAMSGEGGPASLQSLFIDEGFSNLDENTLNVVADALEVLGQDRSRLIGVVTHLPGLAERMPARIVVHKSQSGSTVTVE